MDNQDMIDFRNDDSFKKFLGMKTTIIKDGYAKTELNVQDNYYNIIGSVHGGLIYSLADAASGSASAARNEKMTTINASFNYLSPGMGSKKLIGEAFEIKHGKKTSVFRVEVKDETDKLLAVGTFTYFNLGKY